MKSLKAGVLYFSIERDDNKYADQYVKVVIRNSKYNLLHTNLLAILSDRVKEETDQGLFLYCLYEDSKILAGRPEIIGVDII